MQTFACVLHFICSAVKSSKEIVLYAFFTQKILLYELNLLNLMIQKSKESDFVILML